MYESGGWMCTHRGDKVRVQFIHGGAMMAVISFAQTNLCVAAHYWSKPLGMTAGSMRAAL